MTIATAGVETIINSSHTSSFSFNGGSLLFDEFGSPDNGGGAERLADTFFDDREPYNGIVEGYGDGGQTVEPDSEFLLFAGTYGAATYYIEVFTDNPADYSNSTAAISIDLTKATQ